MVSLPAMHTLLPFSALRHRNFRLFWTGQIISLTGTWMHQAAQGWLVYDLTNSPFFLGLAGTAASAPILMFTIAGGVMADRYPRRKIILTAHIILMALAASLAVIAISGIITIWHVMIIAFLIGTVHAVEIPTRQSFIFDLVGKEDLLNGIAVNSMAFHSARMAGPALAGFVMASIGVASCFFFNSISFLAVITALLMIHLPPGSQPQAAQPGIRKSLKEGFKYVRGDATVSTLLVSVGIISFFGFPYISFLPVYARDILKTGPEGLGILMGCAGAGAFSGAIFLAVRGKIVRRGMLMAVAGIIFSTALMLFFISTSVWVSYIMLFLVGVGALNHIVNANNLLQLSVPNELRGRVMGFFTTMFLGMAPLGNFTVGLLASYTGTEHALTISAGACLAGSIAVLAIRPSILSL